MPSLTLTDSLISTVAGGSPPVQALTLAYAKLHIRSLGTTDDALISVYIDAAASYFESQTGRQLLTATREVWLDAFPYLGSNGGNARIELPHPPLQGVVSVAYVDGNGVVQTLGGSPTVLKVTAPAGPYAARGWVEPLSGGNRRGSDSVHVRLREHAGLDPAARARGALLPRGALRYVPSGGA